MIYDIVHIAHRFHRCDTLCPNIPCKGITCPCCCCFAPTTDKNTVQRDKSELINAISRQTQQIGKENKESVPDCAGIISSAADLSYLSVFGRQQPSLFGQVSLNCKRCFRYGFSLLFILFFYKHIPHYRVIFGGGQTILFLCVHRWGSNYIMRCPFGDQTRKGHSSSVCTPNCLHKLTMSAGAKWRIFVLFPV